MSGFKVDGVLSGAELASLPGIPSSERVAVGPVAYIECAEEFPCNPCETACPHGAIQIGHPITNLPVLIGEKCTGCGLCIPKCPGLAIFVVDMTFSQTEALISLPYEFLPFPGAGDTVEALDRSGKVVTQVKVVRVQNKGLYDRTKIVDITVKKEHALQVRGIRARGDKQ